MTTVLATMYAPATSTREQPSTAASWAERVNRFLNHLILIAVPLQFYAAGLAVFGASSFAMHSMIGQAMVPLALLSFVAAIIGRSAGASPLRCLGLLLLIAAQPVLAFAPRASFPAISAVHPVVGLAIGVLAWRIARR